MNRKNRKLILGTVAVTALGVGGASVAASGTEQPGPAHDQAAAVVQPAAANAIEGHLATAAVPSNDGSEAEVEVEGGLDSSGDSSEVEVPITGTDLEKAAAVALAYTGEGRVTETEVGDEESYYEVEVTLDEGRQIDVQLDEDFKVVGSESDSSDGS